MCSNKTKPSDCTKENNYESVGNDNVGKEKEYYQLENGKPSKNEATEQKPRRVTEKLLFVLVSLTLVLLSHMIVWAQWMVPIFYSTATPLLFLIRAINYWRYKWQYFLVDFCYCTNALTLVYLWAFPEQELVFRVIFALTNGPILVATVVYRNSFVYHHHDKMTSIYIHVMPALTTFCIRWYPAVTSWVWFRPFATVEPGLNFVFDYAVPFGIFCLHSLLYFLTVNVVMKPQDPYLTSYSYLAVKYEKLNCIQGPMGQGLVYYGINWIFCLISLGLPLLAFRYFAVHCAYLAAVLVKLLWNGGSYYMHVLGERGFPTAGTDD